MKTSGSKRTAKRTSRTPRKPNYSGGEQKSGKAYRSPPHDADLHKMIGPIQNYGDDT